MNAWDQLSDEPASAYRRFLCYRDLGPARSLATACNLGAARGRKGRKGTKGNKRPPASGRWKEDSTRFDWRMRALAWDIEQMASQGQQAVVGFVAALQTYTLQLLETLPELSGPATWEQATEALHVLSNLIPAETIQALHAHARPAGLAERNGAARSGGLSG